MGCDWRRLPTAPLHLVLVEMRQVWLALLTWQAATCEITAKVWMDNRGIIDTKSLVRHHFWEKYYRFYSSAELAGFRSDGSMAGIHFKASHIEGYGYVWCAALWILPLAAFGLVAHALCLLWGWRIWSFERGDYLCFTWKYERSNPFKAYVAVMCLAPFVLGCVWLVGCLFFPSHPENQAAPDNNLTVFYDVWLNFGLLVFSLSALLFPLTPVHYWDVKGLRGLRFRRSILHFLLATNGNFGLKLVDGLWTARSEMDVEGQLSDNSRMVRYFWNREDAERAYVQLIEVQHAESRNEFEQYTQIKGNTDESESGSS